jgi:hypothetical protein
LLIFPFEQEEDEPKEAAANNKDTGKPPEANKSKEEATDESKVEVVEDECEEPTIQEAATMEDKNPTPPKKPKLEKVKSA